MSSGHYEVSGSPSGQRRGPSRRRRQAVFTRWSNLVRERHNRADRSTAPIVERIALSRMPRIVGAKMRTSGSIQCSLELQQPFLEAARDDRHGPVVPRTAWAGDPMTCFLAIGAA